MSDSRKLPRVLRFSDLVLLTLGSVGSSIVPATVLKLTGGQLARGPALADAPRPFRVPGYPWTPLLFVLTAASIVVSSMLLQPGRMAIGAGLVLLGAPVNWLWCRPAKQRGPTRRLLFYTGPHPGRERKP